jgi:hypothetical protein
MTKQEKQNWKKRKDLEDEGIDLKPWDGLNAEFNNTLRHEFVKWALAATIYEAGRSWDSEVRFPNGREADIVDLGPEDGDPVVYEVETDYTRSDVERKLNHFHIGPVRDVILIDPSDVPADPEEAVTYRRNHEVIGA